MMNGMISRLKNASVNLAVCVYGLFFKRNNKIILVGAWMGEKFADNSRFLFQYLISNKEALEIDTVVWATRNEKVYRELNEIGYISVLCGTKESKYWHLKAGTHIICNASNRAGHEADIDIQYSWGAKKIQLWHGVGMKKVGASANSHVDFGVKGGLWHKLKQNRTFNMVTSEGGWNEAYFLSTSEINRRVNMDLAACNRESTFISCYPRNCSCVRILTHEETVINKIKKFNGCFLYLPTFRSEKTDYTHPLESADIKDFLQRNNYLWIEKPHSASKAKFDDVGKNILCLDASFDINVLYPYINAIVSDYSSCVFDAIYRHLPTIMYVPDLHKFQNGSNGLLFDIEDYCKPILTTDLTELLYQMEVISKDKFFVQNGKEELYAKIREDFWSNMESSYEKIWNDITRLK
nr:CDP-glycerol glycerophosphotransferase family protein [uncultured Blautia sp.]